MSGAELPLVSGQVSLVDEADLELLLELGGWTRFKSPGGGFYVHRTYPDPTGALRADGRRVKRKSMPLHRFLMGLSEGDPLKVDHINRNGLDNQRSNLRVVTDAENAQNKPSLGGSSRHRGVSWNRNARKWEAHAQLNRKKTYLGLFDDEDAAGRAAAEWRLAHMPMAVD